MKKNNINNRKQRYNLFVEESARVLGGYMMTTEEMTRKQLEKFMVKVARQYVKSNCEKGESYKLIAETTEDAGEMLVISVEAWRATWCRSILVNVYDYEAVDFTTWWSEKKAPKTEEETAEEEPAELFAVNGETFSKGDRVTVETVDAYDAHTSTEAGIMTGYASGQALAEVTTDDGRRVYAHFGSVKHAPAEVVENESECVTVYRHTTGAKVATIARTIADAVGVCFGSSFPASDMVHDLARFDRWQRGESTPDIMDASAAFFFAVRKQGSESGRVSYNRERGRAEATAINHATYKKELQKYYWRIIFRKMNMEKYATRELREQINKFIEQRQNVPFTMSNIYRVIETVVKTNGQRMTRALCEAFDTICSLSAENSTAGETWKTNSNYMVNRRFICDWITSQSSWGGYMEVSDWGDRNGAKMNDVTKALCYMTGKEFAEIGNLGDHVRKTSPAWGTWFEWGFFRCRGYKKGTMHFEFIDENVWARFNQEVAKSKGWKIGSTTNSEHGHKQNRRK